MSRNPVPKTAATTQTRQSAPEKAGVPREAIEAILQARHGDPFAVLGPHQVLPGRWEVRAMLPEALAVDILSPNGSDVLASMERRHESGFFVAPLTAEERPFYRLRLRTAQGESVRYDPYSFGPILSGDDLRQMRDVGSDAHYRMLGAHPVEVGGIPGFRFTVWAPTARRVSVIGDFNRWDGRVHPMRLRHDVGVW